MNLSESNIKIAMDYSIKGRDALRDKDEDYINLFLSFFSDRNSSSLREAVTLKAQRRSPDQSATRLSNLPRYVPD
jgi:hypothetical protein